MTKVLMPCTFYTGYIVQLRYYLKKYYPDFRVSIFTSKRCEKKYRDALGTLDAEEDVYVYEDKGFLLPNIRRGIKDLPRFDVIHFLFIEREWGFFTGLFEERSSAVYVSIGGSDIYRDAKRVWNYFLQKKVIKIADVISSENRQTKDYFNNMHGDVSKGKDHRIVRFGVDVIDSIKDLKKDKSELKRSNGISADKIVVICGHSARRQHQHEKIIDAISRLEKKYIDRLFLLLPMTYELDDESYITGLESGIKGFTDQYRILRDYMSTEQMAEMCAMSDLYIHVQTTDQLSSTMMAGMYAGNMVIAGSWLPYEDLKTKGIRFWEVDECDQLTERLYDIISNIDQCVEECKDNPQKVFEFSSWEHCVREWHSAYEAII